MQSILNLPQVASEYFRRTPAVANDFFVAALRSYNQESVIAGTLAWAILTILPQIEFTDALLKAAIDLVKRTPQAFFVVGFARSSFAKA